MGDNAPISQQWYEAAQKWADLESAASLLEETKSAVLSQMMQKQGDMPVSRAEMVVKGSGEWMGYVEKVVKSRTAANKAKIHMEYLKMKAMEQQSADATARTQARL